MYVVVEEGDRATDVAVPVGVEVAVLVSVAAKLETVVGVGVGVCEGVPLGVADPGMDVTEGVQLAVGEAMIVRVDVDVQETVAEGVRLGVAEPKVGVEEGVHVVARVGVSVRVSVEVPVREGMKAVLVGVNVRVVVSDRPGSAPIGFVGLCGKVAVKTSGTVGTTGSTAGVVPASGMDCGTGESVIDSAVLDKGIYAPEKLHPRTDRGKNTTASASANLR